MKGIKISDYPVPNVSFRGDVIETEPGKGHYLLFVVSVRFSSRTTLMVKSLVNMLKVKENIIIQG